MGDVNQLAYSFKGRRLGYKYRVLRQRIRPVMERISSTINHQASLPEKPNKGADHKG